MCVCLFPLFFSFPFQISFFSFFFFFFFFEEDASPWIHACIIAPQHPWVLLTNETFFSSPPWCTSTCKLIVSICTCTSIGTWTTQTLIVVCKKTNKQKVKKKKKKWQVVIQMQCKKVSS